MNLSKIMPTMNLRKLKILQTAVNVSGVATGRYGGAKEWQILVPTFYPDGARDFSKFNGRIISGGGSSKSSEK